MQEIKSPLIMMTLVFVISFLDGMFGWGFDEGAYMVMGLIQITAIIWMWIVVKSNR
jgi:hypothetical protein